MDHAAVKYFFLFYYILCFVQQNVTVLIKRSLIMLHLLYGGEDMRVINIWVFYPKPCQHPSKFCVKETAAQK